MPNTDFRPIFTPSEVDEYLITPLIATSIAGQVTTEDRTDREKKRYPLIPADPEVGWVAEGAEIPYSEGSADEIEVIPRKVAGITGISTEMYEDSDGKAKDILGDGQVRKVAQNLDLALFGPAPANTLIQAGGLEFFSTDVTKIAADPTLPGLEVFDDAIAAAEEFGVELTHWVTTPTIGKTLSKLKTGEGSYQRLLGGDPTVPTRRQIQGLPVLRSRYVTPGVVWGLSKTDIVTLYRKDATIDVDTSHLFNFDQVAIRVTARAAFGFLKPAGIIRIKAA